MIHILSGIVTHAEQTTVFLKLEIGITFALTVPHATTCATGIVTDFFIHTVWNQETGPSLFGFMSPTERDIFKLLIDAPGIGPKMGISLLDQLSIADLLSAVHNENPKALTIVSGIGLKKAEQLLVALRHKKEFLETAVGCQDGAKTNWHLVQQALTALNYSRAEIQFAVATLAHDTELAHAPLDQLIKKALILLAKKGSRERTV